MTLTRPIMVTVFPSILRNPRPENKMDRKNNGRVVLFEELNNLGF